MPTPSNVNPPPGNVITTGHAPTVWVSANFAQLWYSDAVREATGTEGEHSTRREIVFAASFLESYIFEWVRAISLDRLNEFFPPSERHKKDPLFRPTLKDKWKLIPAELHREGLVPTKPSLDLSQLGNLMRYRNGLIHARASRPSTHGLIQIEQPVPAVDELKSIPHGWAIGVARALVLQLHKELHSTPPKYL